MPRQPTFARRLVSFALWPLGIGLTSWDYMWRTTAMHRRELDGSTAEDLPPSLPPDAVLDDVQSADDGVGQLFHRRYRARIRDARLSAEELMASLQGDPNQAAPSEFARFAKVRGDDERMRTGDEYVVRMPGPWNGPVRVISVTPTSFRLVTLRGHLEAGQIEFRADDGPELSFAVESWARSGDRLSRILYQSLHMAKEVQLHMWTSFLENVARLAGGHISGGIDIDTRHLDGHESDHPLADSHARSLLDALHDRALNFELPGPSERTARHGWTVDEYRQPLPSEAPGAPVPRGSWEVARTLLRDYAFADPSIVRAVYRPDQPLEDRDMLLEVRWHGLRFHLGVRVGGVRDQTADVDGRQVRVWGWSYRTLQGHLEMGQMDYEVWKWLDTGHVEFRITRFSRRARVRNPVVRLGLALFGRYEQVKFARRACQRMRQLTVARLDEPV